MKVVWTDAARSDLRAIHDFIASDSPVAGARTVEAIMGRIDQLEQFPNSGRSAPESNTAQVRELIEGAYRIIYFVGEEDQPAGRCPRGALARPLASDGTALDFLTAGGACRSVSPSSTHPSSTERRSSRACSTVQLVAYTPWSPGISAYTVELSSISS